MLSWLKLWLNCLNILNDTLTAWANLTQTQKPSVKLRSLLHISNMYENPIPKPWSLRWTETEHTYIHTHSIRVRVKKLTFNANANCDHCHTTNKGATAFVWICIGWNSLLHCHIHDKDDLRIFLFQLTMYFVVVIVLDILNIATAILRNTHVIYLLTLQTYNQSFVRFGVHNKPDY